MNAKTEEAIGPHRLWLVWIGAFFNNVGGVRVKKECDVKLWVGYIDLRRLQDKVQKMGWTGEGMCEGRSYRASI